MLKFEKKSVAKRLTSALDRDVWSISLLPAMNRYSLYRRLDGYQGRSGRMRKISPPPGFDTRAVQPVAIRYTDWAIGPPTNVDSIYRHSCTRRMSLSRSVTVTIKMVVRGPAVKNSCTKFSENPTFGLVTWTSRRGLHKVVLRLLRKEHLTDTEIHFTWALLIDRDKPSCISLSVWSRCLLPKYRHTEL